MGFYNGQGIKKVNSDITATLIPNNGSISAKLNIFNNYKNTKTVLKFFGTLKITVPNAAANQDVVIRNDFLTGTGISGKGEAVNIVYKDDHFFNFIKAFQLKADSDIFKNLNTSLSYFKFYQSLSNLGNDYPHIIPLQAIIPAGQTSVDVPWCIYVEVPFIMRDMQNPNQTGLCTWLYNTITASFESTSASAVIKEITNTTTQDNTPSVIINSDSYLDSTSFYQVVDNNYLKTDSAGKPLNAQGVLEKIGGYFRNEEQTQIFTSAGTNQLFKLNSFGTKLFKDLYIVFRDSKTLDRVENIVDKITFTNGDSPLINSIDPAVIRLENIERFKLLNLNFVSQDPTSPDMTGELYGVYVISGDYWGNIMNSNLATGGWQQPQLILDINKNIEQLEGDLMVELYINFNEVSQSVGRIAETLASAANTPTNLG